MAHMFMVEYITSHASGMVESGKAIVVADSHDQAHDIVCQQFQLPPSRTRSESAKIKPPCYALESRESHPNKKTTEQTAHRDRDERTKFHINISASNVLGHNEKQVMRRVGEELCAQGMTRTRHHLHMTVDCWPTSETQTKSLNPMERIEIYGTRNGRVQGGQVSGK